MPEIKIKTPDGRILTIVAKDGKDGAPGPKGDSVTGPKGDSPSKDEIINLIKPLIPDVKDGKDGKDGKSVDQEKVIKEITSKIKLPKDGKDGTNGSPDTPAEVKAKLLEAGLDYEDLKNAPDFQKIIQVYSKQASKTTSLVELDDVDYSGLSIVDGKYVLGGGGLAESFETVSKNLNSYPYELSYTVGGDVDFITYDLGGGMSIVKTFGYTSGDITSIVLSGNTPAGIGLTKTLSYAGGNVDTVVYS